MVRTLKERWATMAKHPTGRWVCLALEVGWYLALVLALYKTWSAPQAWFSYVRL